MRKKLLVMCFLFFAIGVFAQATFTGAIDNDWNKPANWSTALVPNFDTDVIISDGKTVDISSAVVVKSLTLLGGGMNPPNTTINLNADLTVVNDLNQSGLGITVINWSGGTLSAGGANNSIDYINLIGPSQKRLLNTSISIFNLNNNDQPCVLDLLGSTLKVTVAGLISQNLTVNNLGGSNVVFDFAELIIGDTAPGPGPTVIFNCQFSHSGDPIQGSTWIQVDKGTLTLNGANNSFTNSYIGYNGDVAINGEMELTYGLFAAGTANFTHNGNIKVNDNVGMYIFPPSDMKWTGGTINGGGILTFGNDYTTFVATGNATKYLSDDTTIIVEGTLINDGAGDFYITNSTINNLGDIDIQGAGNFYLNNSVLDNQEAGTINLASTGKISANASVTELFNNEGTLLRSTSNGTTKVNCRFHNSGVIEVTSGTLNITGTVNEFNGGMYNVSSGSSLNLQNTATFSGALTGTLDGPMTIVNNFDVPATASWNFGGSSGLQWLSGFMGGGGTLTNLGMLNCSGAQSRYISPGTTLANSGTININGNDLILTDSTLNNLPSGVINLQTNHGLSLLGSATDSLNNSGTINATAPGTAYIRCRMTNTGTINVTSGTLDFFATGFYQFNGGTYNVSSGSALNCNIAGTLSGTLSGVLDGPMNLNTNFDVPSTATNNTTGSAGLHWVSGFAGGGGTFNNATVLHLTGSFDRYLNNDTTLTNSGLIDVTAGNLYLSDSTINNAASGVIDIVADGIVIGAASSASRTLNNSGLLKKSSGNGTSGVNLTLNNSGIIDVQSGTLNLAGSVAILNNNPIGNVMGIGTVNLPPAANFDNNGIFSPGGHPGILSAVGNFEANSGARLAVELNGLTPGVQYDRLVISGNAEMSGTVTITLGFAPSVNDEFVIATTSGSITSFAMPPTASANFNGVEYGFNVFVRNNNEVVLKVSTLGTPEVVFNDIALSPNPAKEMLWIRSQSNHAITSAEICDLNGRTIQKTDFHGNDYSISTENIQSGVYFVRIAVDNQAIVRRIIKQ